VDSGAVYVFVREGTNWTQQAYLKASNAEAGDSFGSSIAISGNTIVVGAYREDSFATGVNGNQSDNSAVNSGAAYVFVRVGTNWSQQAYLKASNSGDNDQFGAHVSIDGDTVVVSTPAEDSNATGVNGNGADNSADTAGAAYVFVRNGTNWHQEAYLKASNTNPNDRFGDAVSISGDTILVGAEGESSIARGVNGYELSNSVGSSGAAYAFVRQGTNWSQQAYFKASNTGQGDRFGFEVAISGDVAVVGALSEASQARGLNGNQTNNSVSGAGAAYAFVRSGTNWSQQVYMKASNTGPDGFGFGRGLAVSGDTVAVGAPDEQSDATGVNGDQDNDNADSSGAVYVFNGIGIGVFPDHSGGYTVRYKQTPGITYRMERAPAVTGPWDTIATLQPNEVGIISVHDTNAPPSQAFYRTATP
jgi:hypothetical protein